MRESHEHALPWSAGAVGAWSAIRLFAGSKVTGVRLVHRGEGRFWSALLAELQNDGIVTELTTLHGRDQRWSPSTHTEGASGDLLIYHDPLNAPEALPDESPATTQFSEVLKRFRHVVFLGYPHGLSDAKLQRGLEQRYLAALAHPVRALQRRAEAVKVLAGLATSARLCSPRAQGGIEFTGPFEAHHDWSLQGAPGRLLQLPLGEAWITLEAIHRTRAHGSTSLPSRGSGEVELTPFGVAAGQPGMLPLCELGVGVNPSVSPLGTSVLSEKADAALHVGLGENVSIGGYTAGPPHGDLMLEDPSEIRLTLPPEMTFNLPYVDFGRQVEPFLFIANARSGKNLGVVKVPDVEKKLVDLLAPMGSPSPAEITFTRFPAGLAAGRQDNILALEHLADPRLSEVVQWSADSRLLGVFGRNPAGLGAEPGMQQFFEAAREILGPLPWSAIDIVAKDSLVARGLSRPGVIMVDTVIAQKPLQLRWLYVSHELIHQWLGGMLRLGPKHATGWEAVCEFMAHAIAVAVLGRDTGPVFEKLQQRQDRVAGVTDPGWTGKSVPTLRRDLRGLRSLLERSVSGSRRTEDIDVHSAVPLKRPAAASRRESW